MADKPNEKYTGRVTAAFDELLADLTAAKEHADDCNGGNKAAGTRLRKALQLAKKRCADVKKLSLGQKPKD